MAAVASEMGINWQMCRGLAVAARSVGLVGHVMEEMRQPIATALYLRTEHEASAHLIPKEHQEGVMTAFEPDGMPSMKRMTGAKQ